MPELNTLNPTERFTGLAQTYAKFRPSYPAHAIDYIVTRCALNRESILVDVGCGTGIASRQMAALGINVVGIEPNTEMRCSAIGTSEEGGNVGYRDGRAEATGLPASFAHAVLSAQAFHWFEPVATLREFYRILKPDGWTVLMWNERDERDPATAAYGDVLRTAKDSTAIEGSRQIRAGEVLHSSPLFEQTEQVTFHNQQALDQNGLLGRALSVSYAPRDAGEQKHWESRLTEVFRRHERDGTVTLRYETTIYIAKRRASASDRRH
jgi:SAM-dependent methyltransferase